MGEGTPHGQSDAISSKTRTTRVDKDRGNEVTRRLRHEKADIVAELERRKEVPCERGAQASVVNLRAQLAALPAEQLGSASGGGKARE